AGTHRPPPPRPPPLGQILRALLPPLVKVIAAFLVPAAQNLTKILVQLTPSWVELAKSLGKTLLALLPLIKPLVNLQSQILPALVSVGVKPVIAILDGLVYDLNHFVIPAIHGLAGAIKAVVSWISSTAIPWFKKSWTTLKNDGVSIFLSMGKDIMGALWQGMKSLASSVWNWFKSFLSRLNPLHWFGGGGSSSPGPSGGQPAANARQFRSMFPQWSSGSNWAAVNNIAMAESGWNNFATNVNSGAYGIPQALPFSKMPKAAWPSGEAGRSAPGAQNAWFGFYMQNRYGGPQQAWAFRQQHGWYDHGGWLQPGLTMALNTTGKPERVGGSAITI